MVYPKIVFFGQDNGLRTKMYLLAEAAHQSRVMCDYVVLYVVMVKGKSMHLAWFPEVWLCNICKSLWRKSHPSLSVSSSSIFWLSERFCSIGWVCTEGLKWSLGGQGDLIWGSLSCGLLKWGSLGGRSFECWFTEWVSTGSGSTYWTSVPATTKDNSTPLNHTTTAT